MNMYVKNDEIFFCKKKDRLMFCGEFYKLLKKNAEVFITSAFYYRAYKIYSFIILKVWPSIFTKYKPFGKLLSDIFMFSEVSLPLLINLPS